MITTIKGDLIKIAKEGGFDVIAHGCNCHCTMGAGIAKAIRSAFPFAYEADCMTQKGDRTKLGSCSSAECTTDHGKLVVINAYTQYDWRGDGCKADYDAIRSCMRWIAQRFSGKRIGLPRIGAGLAGGDWNTIRTIISEELKNETITVVEFESMVD